MSDAEPTDDGATRDAGPRTGTPDDAATRSVPEHHERDDLRVLVLLRHGEAKDSSPDGDFGRELTKSGRKAVTALGEWLSGQGVRPDVVVVSPSTRTRGTWEALEAGGMRARDVWADAAIYDADPEDVIESIQAVPDDARTLLVIGHAPAVPAVARDLPDHRTEGPALSELGWPPAGCAVVGHRGSWQAFPGEASALVAVRLDA